MTTDLVQQGVAALKAGDKAGARQVLAQALRANPRDEQAWLWLSGAVESDDERLLCLNKVLEINPHNQAARRGVAILQKKSEQQAPSASPFIAPESEAAGAAYTQQDSPADQDSDFEPVRSEWDWGAAEVDHVEPPAHQDAASAGSLFGWESDEGAKGPGQISIPSGEEAPLTDAPFAEEPGAEFEGIDQYQSPYGEDVPLPGGRSGWDPGEEADGTEQYRPPFVPDALPPQSEFDSVFIDEEQEVEPVEASVLEQDSDFDEDDVMEAQPGSVFVDQDLISGDGQDLTAEEVEASRWKGKAVEPAPESKPSLFMGIIGGVMATFIAAALWIIISVLTGWQIGYMAIGVGLLVGFGLRSFAGGASASLGCAGGILSLVGCLVGNFVIAVYFVSQDAGIAQDLGYELDFLTMLIDLLSSPALALDFMVAAFDPIDVVFYVMALAAGFSFGAVGRNAGKE